ncbi:MAG: transglutaminase family protein, partial [Planctomycetota bacterium]
MRRDAAITLLGCTACLVLALGGAVHWMIAPACGAALLVHHLLLRRLDFHFSDVVLTLAHAALVVLLIWFVLFSGRAQDPLFVGLTFAAPFLVLRALTPQSIFSDYCIVIVTIWMVIGSAASSEGLVPLLIAAAYLLALCHTLPVIIRQATADDDAVSVQLIRQPRGWAIAPALALHHLALVGLLLGALLYLVVPRLGVAGSVDAEAATRLADQRRGRAGADGSGRSGTVAGFPARVRLGDIGRIKRSDVIAFIAYLRLRGRPYSPSPSEQGMLLLRVNAWESYSASTRGWTSGPRESRVLGEPGLVEAGDAPVDWSISLRGYRGSRLFLPPRPRRIRTAPRSLRVDAAGIVRSDAPLRTYAVEAALPVMHRSELAELEPDRRQRSLLAIPRSVARKLAQNLRDSGIDTTPRLGRGAVLSAADDLERYFRRGGFRYTLDLPPTSGEKDPLTSFLERREGHCELYASAGCLFFRLMGIPARLAGGVRCTDRVERGTFRARFSDAHAWVEVACKGVGFVAFDFTPPDLEATRSTPGAAGADGEAEADEAPVEAAAEGIDWSDPFRYGPREQRQLLLWVGKALKRFLPAVLGVAAVALLLASAATARRRRRRKPATLAKQKTLAFYARWLRTCARQGHRRMPAQTPREFLS